jgi:hypothetical protein
MSLALETQESSMACGVKKHQHQLQPTGISEVHNIVCVSLLVGPRAVLCLLPHVMLLCCGFMIVTTYKLEKQ